MKKIFTRTRRTSEAMQRSVTTRLKKKYTDTQTTERAALMEYTRGDISDFRHLNKELMHGNLSPYNEAFAELLTPALQKLPTVKTTVYRTVRLNKTRLSLWRQQADNKGNISFEGYTSMSENLDVVLHMIQKKIHSKEE